jgi:hypothetical protein
MKPCFLSLLRAAARGILGLAGSLTLCVLLASGAAAQPPQSRFADVGANRIQYLVAGRAIRWSCCTAMRKPATCGCR